MNLILLENSDFVGADTVRLTGRRVDHMNKILKLRPGSVCKAGLLNRLLGSAEVLEITPEHALLKLSLTAPPPPPCPVTLVAALPRPQTYRKVLHSAISMGVKSLVFIHTFKVEKSYWQSPVVSEDFFRREAVLALEQSVDTRMPEIAFHRRFKTFLNEVYPALAAGRTACLAHPGAPARLPWSPPAPALLIVGPEGGFTEEEAAAFLRAGAKPFSLGKRILRTETALPALLAHWL